MYRIAFRGISLFLAGCRREVPPATGISIKLLRHVSAIRRLCHTNLSGRWYNELGSEMEIDQLKGELTGTFINHAPDSPVLAEKLIGSCGKESPTTFGFVVNFEGGKFTTAWSGQYYPESDDGEVLLTTWIMTANLQDANEYWEATNVGQDRFTRKPQKKRGRKLATKL